MDSSACSILIGMLLMKAIKKQAVSKLSEMGPVGFGRKASSYCIDKDKAHITYIVLWKCINPTNNMVLNIQDISSLSHIPVLKITHYHRYNICINLDNAKV